MNTNLSPQREVQRIGFRAIRHYEYCSRMVIDEYENTKETLAHPRPALCDVDGPGLVAWVPIKTVSR